MGEDMIPRQEAERDVVIMARRLAWLHAAYARVLVEELGEERATALTMKAIKDYGNRAGEAAREHVEAMDLPLSPTNMSLTPDLPRLGWEKGIWTDPQGRERPVITHCPLAQAFSEIGEEKLGRLYCYVDQAKVEGYNSDLECRHAQNVLDGDRVCEIVIEERKR